MEKQDMLRSLEEALKYVLCRKLEGLDKASMESAVESFVWDEASRFDAEELVTNFKTPEQSVNRFLRYLEEIGAHRPGDEGTLH